MAFIERKQLYKKLEEKRKKTKNQLKESGKIENQKVTKNNIHYII